MATSSSAAVAMPLASKSPQHTTSRSNSVEAANAAATASRNSNLVNSNAHLQASTPSYSSSIIFPLSDSFLQHPSLSRFLSTSLGSSVFFNRLLSGSIFLKHGNRGSPHYRYVWTSEDLQHIYWGDLKTRKIHSSLLCDSLKAVHTGHQSRIFQERAPKGCDAKKCFSLDSEQRTLDLEAISEEERDIWVLTFQFLLEFYQALRAESDEKMKKAMLAQAIQIANGEKKATIISAIEALIEETNEGRDEGKKDKEKDKASLEGTKLKEEGRTNSTNLAATPKTILTESTTMQTLQNAAPATESRHPLNNPPPQHTSASGAAATNRLTVVAPAHGPASTLSLTPSAPPSVVSNQSAARMEGVPTSNATLPAQVHPMSMTQPMPYRSINSLTSNPAAALAALNNTAAHSHGSQSSLPNSHPLHDRSLSAMSSSSTSAASSASMPAVLPASGAPVEIFSVAALYQSLEDTKRRIETMESDVEKYKDGNKKLVLNSAKKMIKLQESIDQLMYENEILRKQLNMPPLEDAEMEQQIQNQLLHQPATQHQLVQQLQRS